MIQEGWKYAKNFQTVYIAPLCEVIKGGLHQYCCFSFRKEQEKVLATYSTSAEQDGERGGSGEGGTIPHMDKSEMSCVAYCHSPLQIMSAVKETERGVSLSELVTGVTTRQCCWWVSPHTTHTSTPNTHCGG